MDELRIRTLHSEIKNGESFGLHIYTSSTQSRYVLDGRYHIDNNGVENAIRPLAIGRKNYLFCGNHDAAVRAAIVYSLFSCCKAHDIDVRIWLVDILKRIPTEKTLTNYCRVTGRYYPLITGDSRYYQLLAATTRYYLGNGG